MVLAPPPSAGTSSASLYGVTGWGNQPVQAGDLSIPIFDKNGQPIPNPTGDDIARSLASADPATRARIQQALLWGGFYSDSTYRPTLGVFKPEDFTALGAAIQTAGRTQQTLSDTLMTSAMYGVAHGITAAQQQAAKNVVQLKEPSRVDLESYADQAALNVLGRRATPAEKIAFAASYDSSLQALQKQDERAVGKAQRQAAASVNQTSLIPPTLPEGIIRNDQGVPDVPAGYNPDGTPGFGAEMTSLGGALNAAQANQGGLPATATVEGAPSPSAAAENFFRNKNPGESATNDMQGTMTNFLNILSTKMV